MGLDSGRRIGAYEIVGPLGSGGMGEVYRARDTRLGRPVAIKLVSPEVGNDPAAHERLEREARLTSSLNHPNIVTVYDVGEVDGQPFIVMELVQGETLHARMAAGRLTMREAVDIVSQVANGLSAAHDAGVVHRDLKPRNIMLTADGRPKILDFGLGKLAPVAAGSDEPTAEAQGLTGPHAIVGTVGYMSPEQITGRGVDFRSDQFALGSIMYELLTGHRAFKRDTPMHTMAAVVESDPPPLDELVHDAPVELVTVLKRCLAKKPGDRYASSRDLARDLHDVGTAMSVAHSSGSLRRPVRGGSVKWWVAAVAVVGLGLSALAVLWPPASHLEDTRALLARYDKAENVARAVGLLEAEAAAFPSDPVVHATLAEAYWRQAEPTKDAALTERAGVEAATALRLDEGSADVHVVLAMINNGQGRANGGLSEAERALALDPSNGRARRELGRALLGLGRTDEAQAAFLEAVRLAPDDWTTHINLGAFYLSTGRPKDAIEPFGRVLALTPDNAKAFNNLGVTYRALGQYDEAAAMLERSATINPSASAFSNLAVLHYDRGLFAEAAGAFERAVAQSDATSRHWRNLGSAAYWVPGQRERALEAFREAARLGRQELAVDPKDQNVLSELAATLAVLGEDAEARSLLTTLEHLGPESAQVLFTVASTLEELDDRDGALTWMRRAVDAGYSLDSIERSPWLADLRQDPRYIRQFRQSPAA